jgi:hypothetical protein
MTVRKAKKKPSRTAKARAKKAPLKKAAAKKAPAKKAPAKKASAKQAAVKKAAAKKAPAKQEAAEKPAAQESEGQQPAAQGVSVTAVNLGTLFALRPRVNQSFRQEDFLQARRLLADESYDTIEEAARAVAERALELSNETSGRPGRKRGR